MTRAFRSLALVALLLPALGCAGGWRNGVPPQWAGDDVASPTATAAAPAAGSAVSADGVTFRYKGEGNAVNVAGEFNSWSTSADALTKGADGTWSITKKLSPGRYAYKFVVDGSNWKEDPAAKETVDDGFGGKNAIVVVGGTAAPAAAAPTAAKAAGATGDGATFRYSGTANSVNLAGEFNSWSTSADALTKGADGVWSITKKLAPGRYAYKFVVDGSNWKEDPTAKETVDDGFGGKNAIMVVAGTAGAGAAPVASAIKVTGSPRAPQIAAAGVTFTYAGPGSSVALCGSFNDWAINTDPMTQQSDGTWTVTRKLPAGTHTYKFLIDGKTWKTDVANKTTQEDDFGGLNSVLVVK